MKIENLIKTIGGINFLNLLFQQEFYPKYDKMIDRFMVHRNMQQVVLNIKKLRVPYNYLIQLAVKHLDKNKIPMLTVSGEKSTYNEIIKISSDYLNVMCLQSYSILGDMIWDYKNIPVKLSQNILFEKMFTPVQYRPDFVIHFLKNIYLKFFDNDKDIGYSDNDYLKFCEAILKEKRSCLAYTLEQLKKYTKLKEPTLNKILNDVSIQYDKVNIEYRQHRTLRFENAAKFNSTSIL